MIKTVAERQTGERRVCGTDFSVLDKVERHEFSGRVTWVVVRGLCNGVPESAVEHKTRTEALDDYQAPRVTWEGR
jgi:hypothetical protein